MHLHTHTALFADYDLIGELARLGLRPDGQGYPGSPKELVTTVGSQGHRITPVGVGPGVTGLYGASARVSFVREPISHLGDERSDTRGQRDHSEHSDSGPFSYSVFCAGDYLWCIYVMYLMMMRPVHRCYIQMFLMFYDDDDDTAELILIFGHLRCTGVMVLEDDDLRFYYTFMSWSWKWCISVMTTRDADLAIRDAAEEVHRDGDLFLYTLLRGFMCREMFLDYICLFTTSYSWIHSRPWTWIWAWIGWVSDLAV